MMYLKLNADYKQRELVPILDDAIYVYCDVCKSLQQIEDVSYAAFGVCSFEHLNACETCSDEILKCPLLSRHKTPARVSSCINQEKSISPSTAICPRQFNALSWLMKSAMLFCTIKQPR